MYNHPHLTGTCSSAKSFSDFFRVVNSCFAKSLNKKLKRKGQVVMDRFKSPVIETGHDLLQVMFYNDLNPFRTVEQTKPETFKWSSFKHYAYGKKDPLLTQPKCYLNLAETDKERQIKYREMVQYIVQNDHKEPKTKKKQKTKSPYSTVCYIGNPKWVKARYNELKKFCRIQKRAWLKRHRKMYPT
jgi:putative transposase